MDEYNAVAREKIAPLSVPVHALVGCPCCGGKLTEIRGKYPGDPQRKVCPTCLADRLDMIRDMSDPNYGIGCAANAEHQARVFPSPECSCSALKGGTK